MEQQEHKDNLEQQPKDAQEFELDPGLESMSKALGWTFTLLKITMVLLIVIFLAAGFRTVGSNEQAIVLRFGKIRGVGEEAVLGSGLHWILPYPIDEMIKIPVAKKVNLPINSFWHNESKRIPGALNPKSDGYCITRSEKLSGALSGSNGSDYNIVHTKWQLTYQIDDPVRFFKNVYINPDDIDPGQSYADVIVKNIDPMLKNLFGSAVVTAMVHYTIDEVMFEKIGRVTEHIKRLLQDNLEGIESGIKVVSVQSTADIIWPRQVHDTFLDSIKASQIRLTKINEAQTYAENTLNNAGGPVADELLTALKDKNISEEKIEFLWSQLAGAAQEQIANARAYRTQVVADAKANSDYLKQILPEYRKRPELVLKEIYQDAMEYVLKNVDEKIIIQPTEGAKGREIWILLNRDPSIKRKK